MDSPKRSDPRTPPQRPRANIEITPTKYTAVRLIADSLGAGIIGVCLAWGVLEWADHSYHLAELAGQRFQAAAAAQGAVSATIHPIPFQVTVGIQRARIFRARLKIRREAAMSNSPAITPIDLCLNRLDRVKSTGPGTWLASCPTSAHKHGDRSRGLSIRETDDGRILLHCFGGCSAAEVVSAIGLTLSDLYPSRPGPDYPPRSPKGGYFTKPSPKRIPWRDLFAGLEADLLACSLAFGDLAAGRPFSPEDAAAIARRAAHLASEIAEVRHV